MKRTTEIGIHHQQREADQPKATKHQITKNQRTNKKRKHAITAINRTALGSEQLTNNVDMQEID